MGSLKSCCGRYCCCVLFLIFLGDYVSPDYDSQTIAVEIVKQALVFNNDKQ